VGGDSAKLPTSHRGKHHRGKGNESTEEIYHKEARKKKRQSTLLWGKNRREMPIRQEASPGRIAFYSPKDGGRGDCRSSRRKNRSAIGSEGGRCNGGRKGERSWKRASQYSLSNAAHGLWGMQDTRKSVGWRQRNAQRTQAIFWIREGDVEKYATCNSPKKRGSASRKGVGRGQRLLLQGGTRNERRFTSRRTGSH